LFLKGIQGIGHPVKIAFLPFLARHYVVDLLRFTNHWMHNLSIQPTEESG